LCIRCEYPFPIKYLLLPVHRFLVNGPITWQLCCFLGLVSGHCGKQFKEMGISLFLLPTKLHSSLLILQSFDIIIIFYSEAEELKEVEEKLVRKINSTPLKKYSNFQSIFSFVFCFSEYCQIIRMLISRLTNVDLKVRLVQYG
jgi:hypothetical protein